MAQERDTGALVYQLVERTLRKHGADDSSRQTTLQLFNYAVRLLGSNLTRQTVQDEQTLLQVLRMQLEQRGEPAAVAKLAEYHGRLVKTPMNPNTRAGLMALLQRLSKHGGSRQTEALVPASAGASITQWGAASNMPIIHPSVQQLSRPPTDTRHDDTHTAPGAAGGPGQDGAPPGYTVSFPPSLESSFAEASKGRIGSGRLAPHPLTNQHNSSAVEAGFTVKEPLLVRDVLYACQGIAGRFVTYEDNTDVQDWPLVAARTGSASNTRDQDVRGGFAVMAQAQVPNVERVLVSRLTELGWLFRRVHEHAAPRGGHTPPGAIRQALNGALQTELADFYRLMAVLEAHAGQRTPLPGDEDPGSTYLTLRRLVVWLGEPTRRMRLLALLVDSTRGKSGGALAGAIHALAHHGDPFVSGLVSKVLHAVCVPLFSMIRRWVFEGLLEDPHAEFFIRAAPWVAGYNPSVKNDWIGISAGGAPPGVATTASSTAADRDLWRRGYWLEAAQLPAFINNALASKVLRAGKSINFLQVVCGDTHWAQEAGAAAAAAIAQATNPGALDALERAVDTATTLVDKRVMEVLEERFQLSKHCDAMRRYLLLGQGDFVQSLMELVSKELDQAAHNVSEMQLSHALRTAINSSGAKYDDDDVLDRLHTKKARSATGGEAGWDVFQLQYEVPLPLTTIFTPAAMAQYLRVFQLLWSLKRTEASLAACWTTLQCEVHRSLARLEVSSRGGADGVARRFLRLRAEMSHFATNLQYYLMFEVMETAWQEFSRRTAGAADLDTLIEAHEEYLQTLLKKSLLDEASQSVRLTLSDMMRNMLTLHGLVMQFNEVVQGAERRQAMRVRRVAQRTAAGQWGTVAGDDTVPEGVPAHELSRVVAHLADLEKAHTAALQTFTNQLPAQAHDEVRFLLARLDFNEFNARTWRASEGGA